jgi:hypothetical protein
MNSMLDGIGFFVMAMGFVAAISGLVVSNVFLEFVHAMKVFAVSNLMFAIWTFGYIIGIWDGKLPVIILLAMYIIAFISNVYGIVISQPK